MLAPQPGDFHPTRSKSTRCALRRRSFGRVELLLNEPASGARIQAFLDSNDRMLGALGLNAQGADMHLRSPVAPDEEGPAWTAFDMAGWLGFQYPALRGEKLQYEATAHAGGMHFAYAPADLQMNVCLSSQWDSLIDAEDSPGLMEIYMLWGARFWHAPVAQPSAVAQVLHAIADQVDSLLSKGELLSRKPIATSLLEVSLRMAGYFGVGQNVTILGAGERVARWRFDSGAGEPPFRPMPPMLPEAMYLLGYNEADEVGKVTAWTRRDARLEVREASRPGYLLVCALVDGRYETLEVAHEVVRDVNASVR